MILFFNVCAVNLVEKNPWIDRSSNFMTHLGYERNSDGMHFVTDPDCVQHIPEVTIFEDSLAFEICASRN